MDELLTRAVALLTANTQEHERDGRRFRFSCPSEGHYPFQWLWDSCFHAPVWARVDPERAADELRSLLHWQHKDGFVPHVVFWRQDRVRRLSWHHLESKGSFRDWLWNRPPETSALTQPPVLAQALEAVVDAYGPELLDELLPACAAFYRYLARERDFGGDGLIATLCQFETGLDYSPAYDGALGLRFPTPANLFLRARRIQVGHKRAGYDLVRLRTQGHYAEDPLVNAVYGQGLQALARLAARAQDFGLAAWAEERAAEVTRALVAHAYDDALGLFLVRHGPAKRRYPVRTVQGLVPLLLPDLPPAIAKSLAAQVADPRQFGTPYPLPAVAVSEPTFRRGVRLLGVRFIWRGPCSMNTNWLVIQGLRQHGYDQEADLIATRSRAMALRGGFSEFYDPLDGRALGVHRFGWATLAALL